MENIQNQTIFLSEDNKYFKWYWNICNRAKERILSEEMYVEKHHIYPKSIFGDNNYIVKLTAREHYIVHKLLWWGLRTKYGYENYLTRKMVYAFTCMTLESTFQNRINHNSKDYEFLRLALSERMKDKIVSDETKLKLSESHKEQKPSEEHKQMLRDKFSGSGHPQSKRCYQYDIDLNFIKEYECLKDASIELGIRLSNISAVCRCVRKQTNNFIFAFDKINSLDEYEIYKDVMNSRDIRKMPKATPEKINKLRDSHKGQVPWNLGRKCTEEEVRAMSERVSGEKNPNFGKHRTPEVIEKIRQGNILTKRKQKEEKVLYPLF